MRVYVNQHDIEYGIAGDCKHCPLALALQRKTGDRWIVMPTWAYCGNKKYNLSNKVKKFIRIFDDNDGDSSVHPEPFHAYLKRIK